MEGEEKGQKLQMTAATAVAQEATDEAKHNFEELRKSQGFVKSIESQLSSSKAELVKQINEISRLENERHCLSSSLSEVGIIVLYIQFCCNSMPLIYFTSQTVFLNYVNVTYTHIYIYIYIYIYTKKFVFTTLQ